MGVNRRFIEFFITFSFPIYGLSSSFSHYTTNICHSCNTTSLPTTYGDTSLFFYCHLIVLAGNLFQALKALKKLYPEQTKNVTGVFVIKLKEGASLPEKFIPKNKD